MTEFTAIAFAPLMPWPWLAALAAPAVALVAFALWRRAAGALLRAAAFAVLFLLLANPSLVEEQRDPIADVAAVIVDRSASQDIGRRLVRTEEALAAVRSALEGRDDIELRVVAVDRDEGAVGETRAFAALDRALGDVPLSRRAGAILITDGQVHDVPSGAAATQYGPLHGLLTGEADERDRRLTILSSPSFGIVDRTVEITVEVDDLPEEGTGGIARLTAMKDGVPIAVPPAAIGQPSTIEVMLDHGGETIVEFEVEPIEGELSTANNRAAVAINGVRDRLRVLLVSGEPHQGERTWRNILKSDPSVDLVHFTILRPPEKQDGTPINELSLIAFPIRELFELRLDEFDLIIFDQYRRRGVLPNLYLANIADWVRRGGAFLEASGEPHSDALNLYFTPLGEILPAEPTGSVFETGFRPELTELGRRHPVTAGLDGAGAEGETPRWGRWFRQIEVAPVGGTTVMSGVEARPLLILNRIGEGRVAQMASDQIWLWSRGFEGGGPQSELLRRLAHWLMREPELEENDLVARVERGRLEIERRTLEASAKAAVAVTAPDGTTTKLELEDTAPGRAGASILADQPGVWRVDDGERVAVAVSGRLNPPELTDFRSIPDRLEPAVEASGGGIWRIAEDGVPEIRMVAPERDAAGRGWMGLRANGDYVVTGVSEIPLAPALLALGAALAAMMAAWRREGR